MCSIRVFLQNTGDPYYVPTIVVHDKYNPSNFQRLSRDFPETFHSCLYDDTHIFVFTVNNTLGVVYNQSWPHNTLLIHYTYTYLIYEVLMVHWYSHRQHHQ